MLHAVIMAGGAGTRFWPASRKGRPKQLLELVGGQTMIQATVHRLGRLVPPDRVLVVTNERLVAAIAGQLPELPAQAVLGEPCKRDTAPCVGLAALLLLRQDPDAVMAVMPADHMIQPDDVFQQSIRRAAELVEQDRRRFVTFGIKPTYPAESFGYIERGESAGEGRPPAFRVVKFREKPSREVAQQYLDAGRFYWNSGIFVWHARTVVDALTQFEPAMVGHLQTIAEAADSAGFDQVFASEFEKIQGKSIDYAVMERYPETVVIEAPFRWDDVGSWRSLQRLGTHDEQGNTVTGKHLSVGSRNCIVHSDGQHLVVTLGVRDLIIVHTADATLVAHQDDEEAVRTIVQQLEQQGDSAYL